MQHNPAHKTKNIGSVIKQFRLKHKLSLRQLASRVHVSASFLSRIEKGNARPSLDTLEVLAEFFGCPMGSFFVQQDESSGYRISRDGTRRVVHSHDRKLTIEFLTDYLYGNPRMEVKILTMKPAGHRQSTHMHLGEEVIHVLQGKVGIKLGQREIVLKTGETVTFDPRMEHTANNVGQDEARLLVAIAPPRPRLAEK